MHGYLPIRTLLHAASQGQGQRSQAFGLKLLQKPLLLPRSPASCVHLHRPGPVPTVPKYCLKGKGTSFLLSVLFAFISVEPHNSPCARPVVVSPSQLAGLATFCACRSRCIHTRYRSTPDWLLSASLCCRKLEMFEIEGRPHHLHRPCKTASIFTAFRKAHRAITILRQCINL